MPLIPEKLKKLKQIHEATSPRLVSEKLDKLEDNDDKMAETIDILAEELETNTKALLTGLKELDNKKADKQELEEKISQVQTIKGDKGDDGKDYVLTPEDKQEIASKIEVPIVEKVVERTEVIKEQPIVTEVTKEVAVKDTAEEIVDKINTLPIEPDKQIGMEHIEGLIDKLNDIIRKPGTRNGGFSKVAMDIHIVDDETPTGTVNGVNKTFVLSSIPNPATSLKVYVNGQRMRITEDYTLSGSAITFNTAPPTTSIILCDYRV